MSDQYTPKLEDKFTFGLWTVGNPGRDPFGGPNAPIYVSSDGGTTWALRSTVPSLAMLKRVEDGAGSGVCAATGSTSSAAIPWQRIGSPPQGNAAGSSKTWRGTGRSPNAE